MKIRNIFWKKIMVLLSAILFAIYALIHLKPHTLKIKVNPPVTVTNHLGTCRIITKDVLERISDIKTFAKGIPALIHYSYIDENIPIQYLPLIKNCIKLNPGIVFVLWTDKEFLKFIKSHYSKERVAIYRSYLNPKVEKLKKSDEIRNYILHHFGGIYMDMDMKCQKPFKNVLDNYSCILDKEEEIQTNIVWNRKFNVMNNFMACVKRHEFFRKLVYEQTREKGHIIWNTGPIRLTKAYKSYMKQLSEQDIKNPRKFITIASSLLFNPFVVNGVGSHCVHKGLWRQRGCKKLKEVLQNMEERLNNAYAFHLYLGLGYSGNKWYIKRKIMICDFIKKISIFSN